MVLHLIFLRPRKMAVLAGVPTFLLALLATKPLIPVLGPLQVIESAELAIPVPKSTLAVQKSRTTRIEMDICIDV